MISRLHAPCALAATLAAAVLLAGCPVFVPAPNVERITGVAFARAYVDPDEDGEYDLCTLRLDVLRPTDVPSIDKPALLLLHGGGFSGGARDDEDLLNLANELASIGYVCFLSDYRLTRHNPPAPEEFTDEFERAAHAAFVDAKAALRYIRANASQWEVDPQRIGVLGESAGAFAALAAGVTDDTRFASDGDAFPVPPENNVTTSAGTALVIDLWGSAAPVLEFFDPEDPPIMIAHGLLDTTPQTLYLEALRIQEACEQNGIPYELYTFLQAGHGAWDEQADGKTVQELVRAFLERYL